MYKVYFQHYVHVLVTLQNVLNIHRNRIITIFELYIHTKRKLNLHETQINLVKSLLEFLSFHANLCVCHSLGVINHSDLNPAIVNYKVLNSAALAQRRTLTKRVLYIAS